MMLQRLLGALLFGALLAAGAPAPRAPLSPTGETFVSAEDPATDASVQAVFAEGALLGGEPLAVAAAEDAGACSALCRNTTDCSWFNWCRGKGGCPEANGGAGLAYQDCELLSSNCTIVPPVLARGTGAVAGFPLRYRLPTLPGVVGRPGQGVQGADFECEGTLVPGKCAFGGPVSELLATMACTQTFAEQCRSAVVYTQGLDGCSDKLVLLKSADPVPSNTFAAPTVFTMERVEGASTGAFIFRSEASLLGVIDDSAGLPAACGPSSSASGAASGPDAANGTTAGAANNGTADCNPRTVWLGCLVSNVPALMAGDVVATLDGVPSAEACCRECRKRSPAANVFNFCDRLEGCRFNDLSVEIALKQGQCQLRYQANVDPATSTPPVLLAKGEEAGGFTAGTPLAAWAPNTPGFTRYIGGGLFGQPGTPCANSSIANLQECGVQGTVQQVADRCASEADCAAIIFKPGGLGEASITSSLGLLRRPSGANATLMVVNPSTLVYMKEVSSSSSSSGSSSSSSLSAGAIAGIAAGCAVLAVAMAAGGWVALRRRRQRRMQHGELSDAAPKAADEAGSPRSVLGLPPPAPSFAPSSPQAPLSIGTSAPSQNGTSFGAANSHSSPPAAGQHVAHIKLRPVAAASPFASMRQMRMTGSTGTAGSAGSAFTPRSVAAPATGVSQPELHHMMSELMQFRAREDAATGMSSPSSLGPAVPALGSNSGSGGGPSSGGQLSSGGPNTAGTARSSGSGSLPSGHLGRETLPLSLQDWLIPADAIQFDHGTTGELAVLGEGASGRVVRAEFRGEPVAVKEVQIGRGLQVLEAFLLEAQRMQQLRHPNIVSFFGMAVDNQKGLLLMELCDGRDLGSALKLCDGGGTRLFGWHRHGCRIASEVATAVNYLHSQSPAVVHMDIKSTNVLLSSCGTAKLSDVGVSRTQTKTYLSLAAPVGTFAWVAPEVLMGGRCGRAVDIYSFGVLLWEIITGEQPVRGNLRMPRVPEEATQEAAELMEQCTRLDPEERPSAQVVMKRLHGMLVAQRAAARRDATL